MIDVFEAAKFKNDRQADTSVYTECDLLIIDDLGAEMQTGFSDSVLYREKTKPLLYLVRPATATLFTTMKAKAAPATGRTDMKSSPFSRTRASTGIKTATPAKSRTARRNSESDIRTPFFR